MKAPSTFVNANLQGLNKSFESCLTYFGPMFHLCRNQVVDFY